MKTLKFAFALSAIACLLAFTSINTVQPALNLDINSTQLDTLGITNGSVHMRGVYKYKDFLKKYKGSNPNVTIHIWYNPTSSTKSKKEIRAGKDEIYFLYGRNLKTASIEMDFKFGVNAREAFKKKRTQDLINLVDLFDFEIFEGQNFSASMCHEALNNALE